MKKNIALVALALVVILLVVFSLYQRSLAELARQKAEQMEARCKALNERVLEVDRIAKKQQIMAERSAKQAQELQQQALEALEKCRNKR